MRGTVRNYTPPSLRSCAQSSGFCQPAVPLPPLGVDKPTGVCGYGVGLGGGIFATFIRNKRMNKIFHEMAARNLCWIYDWRRSVGSDRIVGFDRMLLGSFMMFEKHAPAGSTPSSHTKHPVLPEMTCKLMLQRLASRTKDLKMAGLTCCHAHCSAPPPFTHARFPDLFKEATFSCATRNLGRWS